MIDALIILLMFFLLALMIQSLMSVRTKEYRLDKLPALIFYLEKRHNIDIKNIPYSKLHQQVIVINSFIMTTAMTTTFLPVLFLFQMLVAFLLIFIQMVIYYRLLALFYTKKGFEKNV